MTIIALETFNGPLLLQVDNSNPALTVTLSKTTVDIQPGDVDTVAVTVSADASLLTDSYTYRLIATDAANIEKSIEVTVDVSGVDYEILVTPASLTVNGSQSATYTVALESIENFNEPVTLSFSTSDDTIVGTFSENPVTLSADTITTVDLSVSTTISTPSEMHELQISASDGFRNKTTSAQLNVVQKPDLTVSALTGTSLIGLQGLLSMNFTIANQGPVNASGRIYYQIVLSDDAVISSEDTVLRSTYFRNLTANSSRNIVYSTVLPAAIAQGNYYLGVIVDFTGQHDESDENNNTRSLALTVQ